MQRKRNYFERESLRMSILSLVFGAIFLACVGMLWFTMGWHAPKLGIAQLAVLAACCSVPFFLYGIAGIRQDLRIDRRIRS